MSALGPVSLGRVPGSRPVSALSWISLSVLTTLLLVPSPATGQTIARDLQRIFDPGPALGPQAEEVFSGHRVGGLSLREHLQSLDFSGCMSEVREEMLGGLDRLRGLHISSVESRGVRRTWKVWNGLLDDLSNDGLILVTTWLDSPEDARRLFFCEDDLPASWRGLTPDQFVVEAITWFDIEAADREHALHKGSPGDREQAVMSLMELQSTLEDRFTTTYLSGSDADAARVRLKDRLDLMWDRLVEPYRYGFTPKARTTSPVADSGTGAYQPVSPFQPSMSIPDPRDVALRDRVARGWRKQKKAIDREILDREDRLAEAVASIDDAQGTEELNRRVRSAMRLDAELAQSVADLERLQSRVRGLKTGRPWVDDMLSNGFRRRAVRRLDRREVAVMRQRDEVTSAIGRAVARGATPPDKILEGQRGPGAATTPVAKGTPGPGNWLDGLPSGGPTFEVTPRQDTIPEGSGWVERMYEGPLPPPSKVWSAELVSAIGTRHPFLDEDDIRILLGLVRETYREIPGRAAIEEVVWRTLQAPRGLRLGGEEATLSDLYLPGESRADQPIITFVLTLKF